MRPVTLNPTNPTASLNEIERASHENDLAEIAQNFTISGVLTPNRTISAALTLLTAGSAFKAKVGTFTRDISLAAGNQSITGLGFKPSALLFLAGITASSSVCWGMDDAVTAVGICDVNNVSPGAYVINFASSSLVISIDGSDAATGHTASMDTDGFTISWGKVGSPTGTVIVNYLAIGFAAVADATLLDAFATFISDCQKGGMNRTT